MIETPEEFREFVDEIMDLGWRDQEFPGEGDGEIAYAKVAARDAAIRAECGWRNIKQQQPEIGQICIVANDEKVLGFAQWGSKDIPIAGWVYPDAPMYANYINDGITQWVQLPELRAAIMGEP